MLVLSVPPEPPGFQMKYLAFALFIFANTAFADFRVVFQQPKNPADAVVFRLLGENHALEEFVDTLSREIQVPVRVPIIVRSCGAPNAYYYPQDRSVTMCYELFSEHFQVLQRKFGNRLSSEEVAKAVASEFLFALLHELGHAVFDLHQIPILGREEDAADQFAAYFILTVKSYSILQHAPIYMEAFKYGLFDKLVRGKTLYSDEHALSEQRLANLVCWGYGKEPQQFQEVAIAIRMSQHRASRCAKEYAQMERSIRSLLGDKLRINSHGQPFSPVSMESANAIGSMLQQYKCLACHDVNARKIGPAFRDIARRYRGGDVEQQLIFNVMAGSTGVWGEVPAPGLHNIPEVDVQKMVRWITSL